MQRTGRTLSALAGVMPRLPQVLINVPTQRRVAVDAIPRCGTRSRVAEAALAGRWRVARARLGHQPKVRVMVEGRRRGEIEAIAKGIARVVRLRSGRDPPQPPLPRGEEQSAPEGPRTAGRSCHPLAQKGAGGLEERAMRRIRLA